MQNRSVSVFQYLRSFSQLIRWLSLRCNQVGVTVPLIVIWPGTPVGHILDGNDWQRVPDQGTINFAAVPRRSGAISMDSSWARTILPKATLPGRLYAAPCWVSDGVAAVLGFAPDPEALSVIEAISLDFAGAFDVVNRLETMNRTASYLEKCVESPDLAIAYVTSRGDILAVTAEGQRVLGTIMDSTHRFLKDSRLKIIPPKILTAIREGKTQVRLDDKRTVVIQAQAEKAPSTLLPSYRVEVLTEAGETAIPIPISRLSPCEARVYEFAIRGLSNKEIARERGCSVSTIRHQLAAVFFKTGIHSRKELILAHYRAKNVYSVPPLSPPKTGHRFPIAR